MDAKPDCCEDSDRNQGDQKLDRVTKTVVVASIRHNSNQPETLMNFMKEYWTCEAGTTYAWQTGLRQRYKGTTSSNCRCKKARF